MANSANSTAITLPNFFFLRPRSSAVRRTAHHAAVRGLRGALTAIGLSAYFVAMPNTPVSQHHSTAPGPPR